MKGSFLNFRSFLFILLLLLSCLFGCKGDPQQGNSSLIKVKVIKVIDGDTVVLEDGQRLRYAGIDAPELYTSTEIPQPFAFKAYKLNKELTEGKTFFLELSLRKKDKYGRLLGELYFENKTSVSEILIREGLAFVCYYPGSEKFYKKYLEIQKLALKEKRGIFSLLPKVNPKIIYIGNKASKRFHHPSCIEAEEVKRKIYFENLEEAFLQGYCPCRKCFDLIFSLLKRDHPYKAEELQE